MNAVTRGTLLQWEVMNVERRVASVTSLEAARAVQRLLGGLVVGPFVLGNWPMLGNWPITAEYSVSKEW